MLDRLEINDDVIVFKCLNNLAPKYLRDQLHTRSYVCNRVMQNANNLNIPCCRLVTGESRFAHGGVKIWNSLSYLTILDTFKLHLFREYLSKIC